MITLDPASACDVCGDAYGPTCLPHSIPCGHSFCRACLQQICEKNVKGGPACPLCREPFEAPAVRLIRVDLTDPLPPLSYDRVPLKEDTDSDLSDRGSPWIETRIREEARKLELSVFQAASTKCTFEEVQALQQTIEKWLMTETRYKPTAKYAALRLSAALLRAILLNSAAQTEQNKAAKMSENYLKNKLQAQEQHQTSLEAEIRRQRQQVSEKVLECQQLQAEVERLRRALPASSSSRHSSPFPGPPSPTTTSSPPPPSASSVQTRYTPPSSSQVLPVSSPPPTAMQHRVPPTSRSSTATPTHVNPYVTSPMSPPISSSSSRSSSTHSSPITSASTRDYFNRSHQTSPTPPHIPPRTAVEAMMVRPSSTAPTRSRTVPPKAPATPAPPPIRTQTRPRMTHEIWQPIYEDNEDTTDGLTRGGTIRGRR